MKKLIIVSIALLLGACSIAPKTERKCINGNKYIISENEFTFCGECSKVRKEIFYSN